MAGLATEHPEFTERSTATSAHSRARKCTLLVGGPFWLCVLGDTLWQRACLRCRFHRSVLGTLVLSSCPGGGAAVEKSRCRGRAASSASTPRSAFARDDSAACRSAIGRACRRCPPWGRWAVKLPRGAGLARWRRRTWGRFEGDVQQGNRLAAANSLTRRRGLRDGDRLLGARPWDLQLLAPLPGAAAMIAPRGRSPRPPVLRHARRPAGLGPGPAGACRARASPLTPDDETACRPDRSRHRCQSGFPGPRAVLPC